MLLWIILLIGLTLCAATIAVVMAMLRAERRARHAFYLAVGLGEDLTSALMMQKGPVSAQLAAVRKTPLGVATRPEDIRVRPEIIQGAGQRSFRITRALNGRPAAHDRPPPPARRSPRLDRREPH